MLVHRGLEAGFVDFDAVFTAHIRSQIEWKTVGVMKLECNFTWKLLGGIDRLCVIVHCLPGRIQNLHTDRQRFKKALFFHAQHVGDTALLRRQIGIRRTHHLDQISHQLVKERSFLAQLVAMANSTPDDAAEYITTVILIRNNAVAHQKCRGADVVGNHAQGFVVQVGASGLAGGSLDQCVEQVNLVIAVHMLQDGGQALQAHAGVHAGGRQFVQAAVGLHVELHEHVVPDFNKAVAVFAGAAGWAAGDVVAVVVKNLATRAAGASVSHHPEVVRLVLFGALFVANADHALRW